MFVYGRSLLFALVLSIWFFVFSGIIQTFINKSLWQNLHTESIWRRREFFQTLEVDIKVKINLIRILESIK